jgi:hypothetical protein
MELFLVVLESGLVCPELFGIGSGRRRCDKLNKSPKLFLLVEVDVRLEGKVGVPNVSSVCVFFREVTVEDLSRRPSLERVGEERLDAAESRRTSGDPGAANIIAAFAIAVWEGEGPGDASPLPFSPACGMRNACVAAESMLFRLATLPNLSGTDSELAWWSL